MELNIKLKEKRQDFGYTLKQVASRVGVSESAVSLYEAGKREPTAEILKQFAIVYETTTDELLGHNYEDKVRAFSDGLRDLDLDRYKLLGEEDKHLLAEQFNALIDRLQKK